MENFPNKHTLNLANAIASSSFLGGTVEVYHRLQSILLPSLFYLRLFVRSAEQFKIGRIHFGIFVPSRRQRDLTD
jgi:hypothetical protein